MVTRYTVVQDGQVYEPGDDVPDMGSITALESKGNYREYNALSKDIDNIERIDAQVTYTAMMTNTLLTEE